MDSSEKDSKPQSEGSKQGQSKLSKKSFYDELPVEGCRCCEGKNSTWTKASVYRLGNKILVKGVCSGSGLKAKAFVSAKKKKSK